MIVSVMQSAAIVLGSCITVVAFLTGCGDSCEDLQEICDRCTDADYTQSCDETVTQSNQTLCDARKTTFNAQCPFVLDPSTTTTTASTGGSGGTASTGGSGGTASTGGSGGTTSTGGSGGTTSTGGTGGAGGTGGTGGA